VSPGKKKVKEDEERLQNELRQLFIDKYRTGHFDSIKSVKKVIKESQKLLKEAENPREKKKLENLIKVTDKELLKLRNRTPQVLKNTNRMQRQLDSIK
jgi:PAB1-binding protein PBP1